MNLTNGAQSGIIVLSTQMANRAFCLCLPGNSQQNKLWAKRPFCVMLSSALPFGLTAWQTTQRGRFAMIQSKQCSKCKEWKPLSEFYHHSQTKDGYRPDCKICKQKQDRQYYHNNRKEILAKMAVYRKEHHAEIKDQNYQYYWDNRDELLAKTKEYYRDNREERIEYAHQYYRENRDDVLAKQHIYSANHSERIAKKAAQWKKANPKRARELARQGSQRRRARARHLPSDLTNDEWEAILNLWGYRCAYCGVPSEEVDGPLQQEHVIPMSQGGGYTASNIVPSCPGCNYRKLNKTPGEAGMTFISEVAWQEQGRLVELRGDMRNPPPLSP